MMYLYLGKSSVKVIGLTKTLLGQYNIAHLFKDYSSEFIVNGKLQGIDLIASAVKEAVSNSQPEAISDKEVCLILPQEAFSFLRYSVPSDISESAILPFIKDKIRSDLRVLLESTYHEYMVVKKDGECHVLFYALEKEARETLNQAFDLVRLKVNRIIPESLAYYTLFEKTLRQDKKENIVYASYLEKGSFAYLFDSHGLLNDTCNDLGEDVKSNLKSLVEKFERDGHKVNRLILSGPQSKTVRQDLFTRDVGAWTNPLEKIVENFYKDYLKQLVPNGNEGLSVLQYDACFGGFIFSEEHKEFTMMHQSISGNLGGKRSLPKVSVNMGWTREIFNLKTLAIFAISFVLSFGIIFAGSRMQTGGFDLQKIGSSIKFPTFQGFGSGTKEKKVATKPTPKPTAEPTPTPSVVREDLQVKVLNGGGVAGKASEMKEILQEAGYTDIVTDNADSFDYTKTEIQLSKDAEDALGYLQEDLADYVKITEASTITDEAETADVIIIIGSDFE